MTGERATTKTLACDVADHATVVDRLTAAMPAGHSVSIGVATWDVEETMEALLERADRLLYEAKSARTGTSLSPELDKPA